MPSTSVKALPADEADIRTFLFMTASRSDSTTYNQYLNDYAEQFPKSSEPYTQRADFYMAHGNYAAAEEDMNAAMDVAEKKRRSVLCIQQTAIRIELETRFTVYKDWDMNKSSHSLEKPTSKILSLSIHFRRAIRSMHSKTTKRPAKNTCP